MLADPVDQRRLLTLADLDSELARVQHTARTLPQHAAIAELMANRQTAGDELVASDTEVEDLGAAVRKAEADLLPVRSRLERERQRIADGSVADAKILRSLTEEVEHVQRRIAELEDVELELMGQLEDATDRRDKVAAAKEQIEVIEHDTDRLQVEVRRGLFKLEKDLPPVDVMFLYQIIEWIGDVADRAERVGNRLEQLLAR